VTYDAGTNPSIVVLGDFNHDGNLDVAVCNTFEIHVLLGNGDGTLQPAKGYFTGKYPHWIVAADFNGDGNLDLAAAVDSDRGPGHVSVLLGNGDGTFQKPSKFPVGTTPWQLIVADFNGDGKPDMAVTNIGDGTVSVLLNTTPSRNPPGN
jgi:hypothetical protein